MKHLRAYSIAVAVGVGLVWAVPAAVALAAALPGLGAVLRAMKTAGVPFGLYSILVNYFPMLVASFAVGAALRRYVSGCGVGQLLACSAPWIIYAIAMLIYIYSGTDISWLGEIPGVAVVPLGLLLAAFVRPPPSLNMPVNTDAQWPPAAARARLVRRLPSR